MHVALIAKPNHADTGVGRYTNQLRAALEARGHQVTLVYPRLPLPDLLVRAIRHLLGWDLRAFFDNYPLWIRYPQADLYHLASQNLASLMLFHRPPGPTIITVHDIIPRLVRDDPALRVYHHRLEEWLDKMALAGLRQAEALVAVSEFTRLSLSSDRVGMENSTAVPLGME